MKNRLGIKKLVDNIIYPTGNKLSILAFSTRLMPDIRSSLVDSMIEFPCFRSLDEGCQVLCEDRGYR